MNVLYISYDGLTDFIGQSQVLPYLLGSTAAGHRLTVISFEKADRYNGLGKSVADVCRNAGIIWLPKPFRSNPPYLAKYIDLRAMHSAALDAVRRDHFDLVHCRSYLAALAGLQVKRRAGIPLLFDMRGLWPDQRRDGGRWSERSPIGRWLYRQWKCHEADLVEAADHIIVLTKAARREIQSWPAYRGQPVSVIPCCADFRLFTVPDEDLRRRARKELDIRPDAPVLAYLGSMGTVYLDNEHLHLFAAIRERDGQARALFIGRNQASEIHALADRNKIKLGPDDFRVVTAERAAVPFWLAAADVGTCLITPTFSSIGVSPTKLAEYMACGMPLIANRSVGDVEDIIGRLGAGHVMADFGSDSMEAAVDSFFALRAMDRPALRERARPFDLTNAVEAYREIYRDPSIAVTAGLP